jgi:hypothetical protein
MDIRFTSSLTSEDENRIAPVLLNALTGLLDLMPITYMIRIETSDGQTYQQSALEEPQRLLRHTGKAAESI